KSSVVDKSDDLILKQELNKPLKNGTMMMNGNAQRGGGGGGNAHHYQNNKCFNNAASNHNMEPRSMINNNNFDAASDPEPDQLSTSSPNNRYMNKFRELRLLDLEIENKVLKNRYMKLKI